MNRFYALALGTILIFALKVPAQQAAPAPNSPNDVPTVSDQLRVLSNKLALTSDQQANIKPILEGLHDATVKISQENNLSREERLAKVRPIRYKAHGQILAILDDEQKKKLELYMQGPHAEMHGNLSGSASSPQPHKN